MNFDPTDSTTEDAWDKAQNVSLQDSWDQAAGASLKDSWDEAAGASLKQAEAPVRRRRVVQKQTPQLNPKFVGDLLVNSPLGSVIKSAAPAVHAGIAKTTGVRSVLGADPEADAKAEARRKISAAGKRVADLRAQLSEYQKQYTPSLDVESSQKKPDLKLNALKKQLKVAEAQYTGALDTHYNPYAKLPPPETFGVGKKGQSWKDVIKGEQLHEQNLRAEIAASPEGSSLHEIGPERLDGTKPYRLYMVNPETNKLVHYDFEHKVPKTDEERRAFRISLRSVASAGSHVEPYIPASQRVKDEISRFRGAKDMTVGGLESFVAKDDPYAPAPDRGFQAAWRGEVPKFLNPALNLSSGVIGGYGNLLSFAEAMTGAELGAGGLSKLASAMAVDPDVSTFSDRLVQGIGSLHSSFLAGGAAGKLAQAAGAGSRAALQLAAAGNAAVSAMQNGGSDYQNLRGQGLTHEEARNRVLAFLPAYFVENLAFNKLGVYSGAGNSFGKVVKSALTEGLQESSDQIISAYSTGDFTDFWRQVWEAGAAGALIGGPVSLTEVLTEEDPGKLHDLIEETGANPDAFAESRKLYQFLLQAGLKHEDAVSGTVLALVSGVPLEKIQVEHKGGSVFLRFPGDLVSSDAFAQRLSTLAKEKLDEGVEAVGEVAQTVATAPRSKATAPDATGISFAPDTNVQQPSDIPSALKGVTGTETAVRGIYDVNQEYRFRHRLVSLDDLITSHDSQGFENPEYPGDLQPRDRGRAASNAQVLTIAQKLNPGAMVDDVNALDRGSPIIGNDGVVESGNGRTIALRYAKDNIPQNYAAYIQYLKDNAAEFGFKPEDVDSIQNPVLVRERVSGADRKSFTKEANAASVLTMSSAESARSDAAKISDEAVMNLTVPEEGSIEQALLMAANQSVISNFVRNLSPNERGAISDERGNLNRQGLERIANALFSKTYGSEAGQYLLGIFKESLDSNVANISKAMFQSLAAVGKIESLIRKGERDAAYSIVKDIAMAVDTYARIRASGQTIEKFFQQGKLLDEVSHLQETLIRFLGENSRSPSKIANMIKNYAAEVDAQSSAQQGTMFGGSELKSKEELIYESIKNARAGQGIQGEIPGTQTTERDSGTRSTEPRISQAPESPAPATPKTDQGLGEPTGTLEGLKPEEPKGSTEPDQGHSLFQRDEPLAQPSEHNSPEALNAAAEAAAPSFDKLLDKIQNETGAGVILGPTKTVPNIQRKANSDYGGDVTKVLDPLRASLIVDSYDQLVKAIHSLGKEVEIVRFKDNFNTPMFAGYRQLLYNVKLSNGLIAEVQVHGAEMWDARKKQGGHKLYKEFQQATRDGDVAKINELEQVLEKLYAPAWETFTNRLNVASSQGSSDVGSMPDSVLRNLPPQALNRPELGTNTKGDSSLEKNRVPAGNVAGNADTSYIMPQVGVNLDQSWEIRLNEPLTDEQKAEVKATLDRVGGQITLTGIQPLSNVQYNLFGGADVIEGKAAPQQQKSEAVDRQLSMFDETGKLDYERAPSNDYATDTYTADALKSYRESGSLLGLAIADSLARTSVVSLVGKKVDSPADLAVLAQAFRDPRFETFRYFFTKNGVIVGEQGLSLRLPGSTAVSVSDDPISELRSLLKQHDADGYWMVHNHPSGDPTPSAADMYITSKLAGEVAGFKGHVVIDHALYSTIDADGVPKKFFLKTGLPSGMREDDPLFKASGEFANMMGRNLDTPEQVVRFVQTIYKTLKESKGGVLIGRATKGAVRVIIDVNPVFDTSDQSLIRTWARLEKLGKATGSNSFMLAVDKIDPKMRQVFSDAVRNNTLLDVVEISTGTSLLRDPEPLGDLAYTEGSVDKLRKNTDAKQYWQPGTKGSIKFENGGDVVIELIRGKADISTWAHELGHFLLERTLNKKQQGVVKRWAARSLGSSEVLTPEGKFSDKTHELFARSFERYLRSGMAPKDTGILPVFNYIRNVMAGIYKRIKGSSLDVNITPAIRGVFDQIVSRQTIESPEVRHWASQIANDLENESVGREAPAEPTPNTPPIPQTKTEQPSSQQEPSSQQQTRTEPPSGSKVEPNVVLDDDAAIELASKFLNLEKYSPEVRLPIAHEIVGLVLGGELRKGVTKMSALDHDAERLAQTLTHEDVLKIRPGDRLSDVELLALRKILEKAEKRFTELDSEFADLETTRGTDADKFRVQEEMYRLDQVIEHAIKVLAPESYARGLGLRVLRDTVGARFDPVKLARKAERLKGGKLTDQEYAVIRKFYQRFAAMRKSWNESRTLFQGEPIEDEARFWQQDKVNQLLRQMDTFMKSVRRRSVVAFVGSTIKSLSLGLNPLGRAYDVLSNAVMLAAEETARFPAWVGNLLLTPNSLVIKPGSGQGLWRSASSFFNKGIKQDIPKILLTGSSDQDIQTRWLSKLSEPSELSGGHPIADFVLNLGFRMAGSIDRPFWWWHFDRSMHEMASFVAKQEGGKVADYIETPTAEMYAYAALAADEAVFQGKGAMATIAKRLKGSMRSTGLTGEGIDLLIETIVPGWRYPGVPANVAAKAIEYAGYGAVKGGSKLLGTALKRGLAELSPYELHTAYMQIGRSATGLGIIYLGMRLFAAGILGAGWRDDRKDRQDEQIGLQPKAGVLEIFGQKFTVERTGGAAQLLLVGASLQRALNELETTPAEDRTQFMISQAHQIFGKDLLLSQPLLENVQEFSRSMETGQGLISSMQRGLAVALVPSLFSWWANDDTRRFISKDPLQGLADAFKLRIPGKREEVSYMKPGDYDVRYEIPRDVYDVLIKNGIELSAPQRRKDTESGLYTESIEDYKKRVEAESKAISNAVMRAKDTNVGSKLSDVISAARRLAGDFIAADNSADRDKIARKLEVIGDPNKQPNLIGDHGLSWRFSAKHIELLEADGYKVTGGTGSIGGPTRSKDSDGNFTETMAEFKKRVSVVNSLREKVLDSYENHGVMPVDLNKKRGGRGYESKVSFAEWEKMFPTKQAREKYWDHLFTWISRDAAISIRGSKGKPNDKKNAQLALGRIG